MQKFARLTDAALLKRTGQDWAAWIALLDAAGAASLPHPAIARLLHEQHGIDEWYAQTITVGYEQARGIRVENQKCDGFAASVSRTVDLPIDEVHARLAAGHWLHRLPGAVISSATPPKSVRLKMPDGTRAALYLTPKPNHRTSVQAQHEKLPSAAAIEPSRQLWREILDSVLASA